MPPCALARRNSMYRYCKQVIDQRAENLTIFKHKEEKQHTVLFFFTETNPIYFNKLMIFCDI
jgi:FlaA1/EpsC-like NDP-sugar epimerase